MRGTADVSTTAVSGSRRSTVGRAERNPFVLTKCDKGDHHGGANSAYRASAACCRIYAQRPLTKARSN